jgi:phage gpG-like protein
MKIAVEQRGAGKAAVDLHKLGVRASDVRPIASKTSRIIAESNERRFQTRGRGRWEPLDPDTSARKSRQGEDPRLLRRTNKLHASLTRPRPSETNRTELSFGTDLPYARFVNSGTKWMPARKLIDLAAPERKEITKVIGGYIAKEQT